MHLPSTVARSQFSSFHTWISGSIRAWEGWEKMLRHWLPWRWSDVPVVVIPCVAEKCLLICLLWIKAAWNDLCKFRQTIFRKPRLLNAYIISHHLALAVLLHYPRKHQPNRYVVFLSVGRKSWMMMRETDDRWIQDFLKFQVQTDVSVVHVTDCLSTRSPTRSHYPQYTQLMVWRSLDACETSPCLNLF